MIGRRPMGPQSVGAPACGTSKAPAILRRDCQAPAQVLTAPAIPMAENVVRTATRNYYLTPSSSSHVDADITDNRGVSLIDL